MNKILIFLLFFVAITSIMSGIAMMFWPDGLLLDLPTGILHNTPFRNFLIPGLLLAVIVGGVASFATVFNIRYRKTSRNWAIAAGITVIGWIVIQIVLIQFLNWLHCLYLGIGICIILLAQISKKPAA